jgi:excisionase family DNA binding protein
LRLLKPLQVCTMLRVSKSWLYRAATEGTIPWVRLGGEHVATDVRA